MVRVFVVGGVLLFWLIVLMSKTTPAGSCPHRAAEENKPTRESPGTQRETGFVSAVNDGDTITIRNGTNLRKFRLAGIDAPELYQSFGQAATDYLRSLAPVGAKVEVEIRETDKYDRPVAFLRVGGLDLNLAMVTNGLAWSHVKFDRDHRFRKPQHEAREARRGLWADPDPTPPWNWKKDHPRE